MARNSCVLRILSRLCPHSCESLLHQLEQPWISCMIAHLGAWHCKAQVLYEQVIHCPHFIAAARTKGTRGPYSRSSGAVPILFLGDAKLPNGPSGWFSPISGISRRLMCLETESSNIFDHLKYGGSTYAEQSKIDELQASQEDRWLHHRPGELRSSKSVCKAGELALLSSVLPCK